VSAKIRAWIFDLGNTLMSIPREHDEEECLARILGMPDADTVRSIIYRICDRNPGQSVETFLDRFDREVNPKNDIALCRRIREAWKSSVDSAILTDGAIALLDDLRQRGMRLAMVSNTPPTSHHIITRLGLRDRFDAIVFSCDVGFLKPDPRIFRRALEQLKSRAEETVVVGDKIRTDILGGAILGFRSILVETRMRSVVENGQSYVDAIVPAVSFISTTRLYQGEFA
jgi:HAD superfamily hydrolase (TIGR01509 family)